ncbi:MAG: hypothetical protein ABH816_03855 [Candidatus Levyibacteriota bacterium]
MKERDGASLCVEKLLHGHTLPRGKEINLATGFAIQEASKVNPKIVDLQKSIIAKFLNPQEQITVFCTARDIPGVVGTVGLIENSDSIKMAVIWNRHPTDSNPRLWVGFYNPLQWTHATEMAEAKLKNVQVKTPSSTLLRRILSMIGKKDDSSVLPPVMGLKPDEHIPHMYISQIGWKQKVNIVGEESIKEKHPRLYREIFCPIKEEFLQAIEK